MTGAPKTRGLYAAVVPEGHGHWPLSAEPRFAVRGALVEARPAGGLPWTVASQAGKNGKSPAEPARAIAAGATPARIRRAQPRLTLRARLAARLASCA